MSIGISTSLRQLISLPSSFASSSRLTLNHLDPYPPSRSGNTSSLRGTTERISSRSIRFASSVVESLGEPAGFEDIPTTAYSGSVETASKGKGKVFDGMHVVPPPPATSPRKRMDIRAKKNAITLVSVYFLHPARDAFLSRHSSLGHSVVQYCHPPPRHVILLLMSPQNVP